MWTSHGSWPWCHTSQCPTCRINISWWHSIPPSLYHPKPMLRNMLHHQPKNNPLLGMQMKLSKLATPKKANSPKDTSSWCLVAFWSKNVIPLNLCCNSTWLDPSKPLTSFALRRGTNLPEEKCSCGWGKILWLLFSLPQHSFHQKKSTTVMAPFAHKHSSKQWSL